VEDQPYVSLGARSRPNRNANGYNGTMIVQAGRWGERVGRVALALSSEVSAASPARSYRSALPRERTGGAGDAPAVPAIPSPSSRTSLSSRRGPAFLLGLEEGDTPLGNWVADVILERRAPTSGHQFGRDPRAAPGGHGHGRGRYTVLPFDNTIVTVPMKGWQSASSSISSRGATGSMDSPRSRAPSSRCVAAGRRISGSAGDRSTAPHVPRRDDRFSVHGRGRLHDVREGGPRGADRKMTGHQRRRSVLITPVCSGARLLEHRVAVPARVQKIDRRDAVRAVAVERSPPIRISVARPRRTLNWAPRSGRIHASRSARDEIEELADLPAFIGTVTIVLSKGAPCTRPRP